MELVKPLFGKAPKAFQSVDVDSAPRKAFGMVDVEMPVAAEHEAVVGLESVGVNDASSADGFDREIQERLRGDIGNLFDPYAASTLQDAEHGDLSSRTAPAFPFAPATKVGLIKFHFPTQKSLAVLCVAENGQTKESDRFVGRLVADSQLAGHLSRRYFQFEELDHAKPLGTRQPALPDPPSREFLESVTTLAAASPAVRQTIQFSASATGTNALLEFEAISQHVSPGPSFAGNQTFIGLQVHGTILAQVPDRT